MRQIQEKLVLLRVSGEFEFPRVRVIGVQLYVCYFLILFLINFFMLFFIQSLLKCEVPRMGGKISLRLKKTRRILWQLIHVNVLGCVFL